ncbi:MAG: DUF4942 domain-containing protein [Desulfobacterales bacterium]|nr:DUF4942 domain-containing protein [Desulfobacterales bacterium]
MSTTTADKKQKLIELSKQVKFLMEIGDIESESCNEALIEYYKREDPSITEFKTFKGWKDKGRFVAKGSKAYLIWGKKRKITKQETDEEKKEYKFFPVAYLFANTQLKEEAAKEDTAPTKKEITTEITKLTTPTQQAPQTIKSNTPILTTDLIKTEEPAVKEETQLSMFSAVPPVVVEKNTVEVIEDIKETEIEIIEEPQQTQQKREKAFNTDNKDFYPTPFNLCLQMTGKLKQVRHFSILEPSAGAGDLAEVLKERFKRSNVKIKCIEKDPKLVPLLQDKNYPVIDRDFLEYAGNDQFDAIVMNPPFSEGDQHLLKAIDIMFNGEIVCLLNAETLKNPYSNTRRLLKSKLEELNADIEYIQDAFKDAQRKTAVEVALVYIKIDNKIEDSFIDDMDKAEEVKVEDIKEETDVSKLNDVESLVEDYNKTIEDGKKVILDFYKNHKIRHVISIQVAGVQAEGDNLTAQIKDHINNYVIYYRKKYWNHLIDFQSINKKMTEKKIKEFKALLSKNEDMDFTIKNIHAFITHIMDSYEDNLIDAVETLFDKMTISHAYGEKLHTDNIHMFNGWKTNNAYKVGKKVILPMTGFRGYWGDKWEIDYRTKDRINDIDKVMNFFDGNSEYTSIASALEKAFALEDPQTRKVKSTYFTISVFKKGTIHLEFRNMDILRRFNVEACKRKNFIPEDYGNKKYESCSTQEKDIINTFENKVVYSKNVTDKKTLFAQKDLIKLN